MLIRTVLPFRDQRKGAPKRVVCQPKIARFGLGKGEGGRGKELKPFPFTPCPLKSQVSLAN